MSTVCAQEINSSVNDIIYQDNIQEIQNAPTTYEIDENNYDKYFDADTGKINDVIASGDTIKLGNLTDKNFIIDKTINIESITPNDKLNNCLFVLNNGANSVIDGIRIFNNESAFKNENDLASVYIYNSANSIVNNSFFYLNTQKISKYSLILDSSNDVKIENLIFNNSKKSNALFMNQSTTSSFGNCSFYEFGDNLNGTIISNDLIKIEKNASDFEVKVLNKQGEGAAGYKVIFSINGIDYERISDQNGYAKIAINLSPGEYNITTTNVESLEKVNNIIKVLPRFNETNDLTKYYKNASQYVIKLIGDDGKAAKANEIVTFNINGVFYNRTTNATGHVTLNINLQPGKYIITAEYKNCCVSNNITVLKVLFADNLTKTYGTKDTFNATLLDGQGKKLADATVTFNVHGVFYYRTTDSNGIAKLNINLMPGEYIITSSYNGCYVGNKITVLSKEDF